MVFTPTSNQEGKPQGSREIKGPAASLSTDVTFSVIHVFDFKTLSVVKLTFIFQEKASKSQTTIQSSEGENRITEPSP